MVSFEDDQSSIVIAIFLLLAIGICGLGAGVLVIALKLSSTSFPWLVVLLFNLLVILLIVVGGAIVVAGGWWLIRTVLVNAQEKVVQALTRIGKLEANFDDLPNRFAVRTPAIIGAAALIAQVGIFIVDKSFDGNVLGNVVSGLILLVLVWWAGSLQTSTRPYVRVIGWVLWGLVIAAIPAAVAVTHSDQILALRDDPHKIIPFLGTGWGLTGCLAVVLLLVAPFQRRLGGGA